MITSRTIALATVVLVSFCSCRKEERTQQPPGEIIRVDPKKAVTKSFEDIFDKIRFLKLETSDSSLIGKVKNMFVTTEKIFVSDAQGVFVFDHNGSFLSKLKRPGRAPGEYLAFTSLSVDTANSIFEVLDNRSQQIAIYDYNGHFIAKKDIPIVPLSFIKANNEYFFFTGNQYVSGYPYSLVLASVEDEFVVRGQYFPVSLEKSKYMHIQFNYNFYAYQDTIRFFRPLADTIYSILNHGSVPRYSVDFGEQKIPKSFYDNPFSDIREFYTRLFEKEYAYNISAILETTGHLMFVYHIRGKAHQAFYNKHSKEVTVVNRWKVGFLAGKTVAVGYALPRCTYKGYFYGYIEPYDLISTLDSIRASSPAEMWDTFLAEHMELAHIYSNAEIDDNPILLIYNLKQ